MAVGGSALGPLMLALGRSWHENYRPVLLAMCVLPALVVLVAAVVKHPPSAPPGRRGE